MSTHNSNNTESLSAAEPSSPAAFDIEALSPRQQRVVLVCDVVESVRWMEHDEDNAITRWSQFATAVRSSIAPAHGGEVIKSTGDGLMMQFQAAPIAVAAANAMQKIASEGNQGYTPERQMHLRIGIHQTQARRDAHDLYGHGVNLAARITTLAGPGEIVVTPEVRDHLTDSLDGEIEDMGECYLKHLSEPQRVYRVGLVERQSRNVITLENPTQTLLMPCLAVLPFSPMNAPERPAANVICDGVINVLSGVNSIRVISRLSTSALHGRDDLAGILKKTLKCSYALSGNLIQLNNQLHISVELCELRNNTVCWSDRFKTDVLDVIDLDSQTIQRIASSTVQTILSHEAQLATYLPIPNLSGQSLLLSTITSMHRAHGSELTHSKAMLDALVDRYRRHGSVHAWTGKWHVLKLMRGLSDNPDVEARTAISHAEEALHLHPGNEHALAVLGHVLCHFGDSSERARDLLDQSINANTNEPTAWLYRSVWYTMWGDPKLAVSDALRARELSPVDPMAYYFDMIAAFAYAYSNQYELAIDTARRSLRANRHHAPTIRALLLAQVESGKLVDAQATLKLLMTETPDLTITSYKTMGSANSQSRQRVISALRFLNVPD